MCLQSFQFKINPLGRRQQPACLKKHSLQKAAFYCLICRLSGCNTRLFALQKVMFHTSSGNTLTVSKLRSRQKSKS